MLCFTDSKPPELVPAGGKTEQSGVMGNSQGKPVEFDGEGASYPRLPGVTAILPPSGSLTPPLALSQ